MVPALLADRLLSDHKKKLKRGYPVPYTRNETSSKASKTKACTLYRLHETRGTDHSPDTHHHTHHMKLLHSTTITAVTITSLKSLVCIKFTDMFLHARSLKCMFKRKSFDAHYADISSFSVASMPAFWRKTTLNNDYARLIHISSRTSLVWI